MILGQNSSNTLFEIKSLTAPYISWSLSYIHISTRSLLRMSAIWWAPYLAVRNFSLFFSSQPFDPPKLTCLFGVPGTSLEAGRDDLPFSSFRDENSMIYLNVWSCSKRKQRDFSMHALNSQKLIQISLEEITHDLIREQFALQKLQKLLSYSTSWPLYLNASNKPLGPHHAH